LLRGGGGEGFQDFGRKLHDPGFTPEAFELEILAGLGLEDVDEVIAIIGQNPFAGFVAFEAVGEVAVFVLDLEADFIGDGLHLAGVGAGADDEMVGERGYAGEVENDDVGGLFFTGGADGGEPCWFQFNLDLVWY